MIVSCYYIGKNIIVCNDGYKVKLIDFGTACKTDSVSRVKSGWTPVYAAPEVRWHQVNL